MGAAGLEQIWTLSQNSVVMSMNETEAERKETGCLPLGVVGEKSFSDPTSDTWKNKKADL